MRQNKKAIELHDLHAQQQKLLIGFSALICVLILLGAGWVFFKPNEASAPEVFLLKDKWDLLETSARGWQSDAYLTDVRFYIRREIMNPSALRVYAEFHSSQVPSGEMLIVRINNSGKVVSSVLGMSSGETKAPPADGFVANVGSAAEKPIYQEEWSIDTQDALNIFAQNQEVGLCLKSSQTTNISLALHKVYTEYPAWELDFENCPDSNSFKSYYLNAKTGELFDPFKP